ncbi:MAG: hypothetical protein RRC07_15000 [Anaerolineae bacterium]|nr:hypothetical protein [Anaerolineae bacterium]
MMKLDLLSRHISANGRYRLLIPVAVLSLILLSCGGQAEDLAAVIATGAPTTAPANTATATPQPSPAATASPTPQPSPTSTPTNTPTATPTATPVVLTEEMAAAALLALDDFPAGWQAGGPGSIIRVETGEPFSFLCEEMEPQALFKVEAIFTLTEGVHVYLTHAIIAYPPGVAAAALAAFRQAVEICETWNAPLHFGDAIGMQLVSSSSPGVGMIACAFAPPRPARRRCSLPPIRWSSGAATCSSLSPGWLPTRPVWMTRSLSGSGSGRWRN